MDIKKKAPKLEEVPVVNEFPEVSPDELLGLPLDREIEVSIVLVPGTEPESRASYYIAPVGKKGLIQQLQELLDKEVIRPSVS